MAININQVYKTVLSILNKEQRGYLNPYEYNNIARQVQLEFVEKMFYDYNRFLNIEKAGRINETYADIPTKIQEQLDEFYVSANISLTAGVGTLPTDLYKMLDVTTTNSSNNNTTVEKIDKNKLPYLQSSPLTQPSTMFPVYHQRNLDFVVNPTSVSSVVMQYIQQPADPRWGYTVDTNYGNNIYDSVAFVDGGLINSRTLASTSSGYTQSGTYNNGTYNFANEVQTSGGGSGAQFTLTIASNAPTTLVVTQPGSGYAVGDTFNSSTRGSTDFQLHASQESELVISILAYAGFVVKDPSVFSGALQVGQGTQITKQQQ